MNVIIYGAGENGFQAFHAMRHDKNLNVIGFLDGNPQKKGTTYLNLPVFGDFDQIPNLRRSRELQGGIAAVGDNWIRRKVARRLKDDGLSIVSAIHPTVMFESPEHIGEGVIFEMGAAIHAGAWVGDGVFMGTSAIVAHHSRVGNYTILSGGVSFGGRVTIGECCVIGVGAALQPHITIGTNVIVGVGSAVVRDLPDDVVAVGVPAKVLRPNPRPSSDV